MKMLRGTPSGLQIVFDGRPFGEVAEELWSRFAERADFYRGSSATVIFQESAPAQGEFERFLERTRSYGVAITGLGGIGDAEGLARDCALPFLGAPALGRLTEQARSLDADFAGARGDLARRRARRARAAPQEAAHGGRAAVHAPAHLPATLYVRRTVRGGQSLQQLGNIVVVGDVNPGAEIVASGDVVVLGSLRGTVHAGAQGDVSARVIALELIPTQLRIASSIAADAAAVRAHAPTAEEAFIEGGRIVIAPLGRIGR